jgi:hypothetical protein
MMRLIILIIAFCGFFPALALGDSHDPKRIMPAEVMMKMNAGEAVLFLDTRNTRDWNNAKEMIPDAIRISSNEVLTRVAKETPKETLIVTYCT